MPESFVYWGYVYDDKIPVRDPSSRWYMSKEEYEPDEMYPPYACGAFYFMTSDLAALVAQKFREPGFRILPFEDIHMGIVVNSLGYKPEHNHELFFCDRALSRNADLELFVHLN